MVRPKHSFPLKASLYTLALIAAVFSALPAHGYDGQRPHAFERAEPGNIDYYTLVLTWSPTHCLTGGNRRGDRQCAIGGAPDFVLHGLWPQYDFGWPEDCYRGKRPWIPEDALRQMRGIMPDKNLAIHEYKTHGTCSGLSPAAYFAAARKAYTHVTIPKALNEPKTQRFLSPEQIEKEFLSANDWLQADMIAVSCRRGNLYDVRICFSTDLAPRACGANIDQRRLCPLGRIAVPAPRTGR
ncbi:MAG: ribonuclease T [Pseudomonadota bacterium]